MLCTLGDRNPGKPGQTSDDDTPHTRTAADGFAHPIQTAHTDTHLRDGERQTSCGRKKRGGRSVIPYRRSSRNHSELDLTWETGKLPLGWDRQRTNCKCGDSRMMRSVKASTLLNEKIFEMSGGRLSGTVVRVLSRPIPTRSAL